MQPRFVDLLLVVVLMALGLVSGIVTLAMIFTSKTLDFAVVLGALISIGLLLSAYGIWYGKTWGYIAALGFTTISLIGNILIGSTLGAVLDALLAAIALYALLTRSRLKLPLAPSAKPATPPPTTPIALAYAEPRRRFVRRRR